MLGLNIPTFTFLNEDSSLSLSYSLFLSIYLFSLLFLPYILFSLFVNVPKVKGSFPYFYEKLFFFLLLFCHVKSNFCRVLLNEFPSLPPQKIFFYQPRLNFITFTIIIIIIFTFNLRLEFFKFIGFKVFF